MLMLERCMVVGGELVGVGTDWWDGSRKGQTELLSQHNWLYGIGWK